MCVLVSLEDAGAAPAREISRAVVPIFFVITTPELEAMRGVMIGPTDGRLRT